MENFENGWSEISMPRADIYTNIPRRILFLCQSYPTMKGNGPMSIPLKIIIHPLGGGRSMAATLTLRLLIPGTYHFYMIATIHELEYKTFGTHLNEIEKA